MFKCIFDGALSVERWCYYGDRSSVKQKIKLERFKSKIVIFYKKSNGIR